MGPDAAAGRRGPAGGAAKAEAAGGGGGGGGRRPRDWGEAEVDEYVRGSLWFDLRNAMGPLEWFKFVVFLPLAVARFALFFVSVAITCAIVMLLGTGLTHDGPPASPWRRAAINVPIQACGWVILFCFGIFPRVRGWENLRQAEKERAIGVFNHISMLDGFLITALYVPNGVTKASVATTPLLGPICRVMQLIHVERAGAFSNKNCVGDKPNKFSHMSGNAKRIRDRAADPRYRLVIMSPEGTTTNGQGMAQFSTGAFLSGLPILPIMLRFPCNQHPGESWLHRTLLHQLHPTWGLWYGDLFGMFRILAQLYTPCEVDFLPLYYPSEEEKADPALFAENVRQLMAEDLGVQFRDEGLVEVYSLMRAGVHLDIHGKEVVNKARIPEALEAAAAFRVEQAAKRAKKKG